MVWKNVFLDIVWDRKNVTMNEIIFKFLKQSITDSSKD